MEEQPHQLHTHAPRLILQAHQFHALAPVQQQVIVKQTIVMRLRHPLGQTPPIRTRIHRLKTQHLKCPFIIYAPFYWLH